MSLCVFTYNNIKGINKTNDLVQIMEMDNQLYSTLSQRTMFYLQYDYRSFDFHLWVSSN